MLVEGKIFPYKKTISRLFEVECEVLKEDFLKVEISVNFVKGEEIKELNKKFMDIYKETDVLSFPNVNYSSPADFSEIEDAIEDYFDPENGELCLGDIVISIEKVYD